MLSCAGVGWCAQGGWVSVLGVREALLGGEVGRSRNEEQLFPCTATTQPQCVYAGKRDSFIQLHIGSYLEIST